jgi:cephalosporin hydroxylase
MERLSEIYERHKYPDGSGDKGTAHTYIEIYEDILLPYRQNTSGTLMEIGIGLGHSIRMWGEYYAGRVIGVDVRIEHSAQDLTINPRYDILQCDATSPELLRMLGDTTFDVIIDDGSHMLEHQMASFKLLKHKMNPGGVYIIEDILYIDEVRARFESIHTNCRIVDNRHVKGRYDDVLAIYTF